MNRWSSIKKCTYKFCATVTQVESPLHPSGVTEQDKVLLLFLYQIFLFCGILHTRFILCCRLIEPNFSPNKWSSASVY